MIYRRGSKKIVGGIESDFLIKWRELIKLFNACSVKKKRSDEIKKNLSILKSIILRLTKEIKYELIKNDFTAVSTFLKEIEEEWKILEEITEKKEFSLCKKKIEDKLIQLRVIILLVGKRKLGIDEIKRIMDRRNFLKKASLGTLALAAGMTPRTGIAQNNPLSQIGKKALDFSQLNINSKSKGYNTLLGPQNFRGKVVIVNFWSIWCEPCIRELPEFQKIKEKYPEVIILAVEADEEPMWKELSIRNLTFPILSSRGIAATTFTYIYPYTDKITVKKNTKSNDMGLQVERFYGSNTLPLTFLIDKEGIIKVVYKGGITSSLLETDIKKIL